MATIIGVEIKRITYLTYQYEGDLITNPKMKLNTNIVPYAHNYYLTKYISYILNNLSILSKLSYTLMYAPNSDAADINNNKYECICMHFKTDYFDHFVVSWRLQNLERGGGIGGNVITQINLAP